MKKPTQPRTKTTPPLLEPPTQPATIRPSTLGDLQAFVAKPITIRIDFEGQSIEVPARRLTPAEDAVLDDILAAVIPPMVKGKTMDDDRPDYTNTDFVKRKMQAELEVRALAIYWCVPMFVEERPGLTDRKQITDFVQSKLTAKFLESLFLGVRDGGVRIAELVNFTSPSASRGS